MHLPNLRWCTVLLGYLVTHVKAYPVQAWYPPQGPREYPDDEYYYAPKVQYYYDAPAMSVPEVYGQMPYPYMYDPYEHFFANDGPKRQEERLAALPIGQETWFENEGNSRWRSNDVDDVSAAFLDNLILTQMAQDAQRRRENSRANFPPVDYDDKNAEDEDVRELKALAGQPLYHVPKTVPKVDDYDAGQPLYHIPKTVPKVDDYDAGQPLYHIPKTVPKVDDYDAGQQLYHVSKTVPKVDDYDAEQSLYHVPKTVPKIDDYDAGQALYHVAKTAPKVDDYDAGQALYHVPKTVPTVDDYDAGQQLYHVPKTVPKLDDYDYASDEGFINWNGNKRSPTTVAPTQTTVDPKLGQKEVAIPPQGQTPKQHRFDSDHKRKTGYYDKIIKLMMANSEDSLTKESTKERRIDKRFVAGDSDLVLELRGLKQRIAT